MRSELLMVLTLLREQWAYLNFSERRAVEDGEYLYESGQRVLYSEVEDLQSIAERCT